MAHTDLPDHLEALASLTDRTRRQLYDFVRMQRSPQSRDDAAGAIGVTRSLAAYHLDRLAAAGLLDTRFERRGGRSGPGAGRPAKLYSRPEGAISASVPARDYRLAALVLAQVVEGDATGAVRDAVLQVARRMGASVATAREATPEPPDAAASADELNTLLTSLGYEPFDDDNTVRLRNCLFEDLVEVHRDLACTMNLGLVEGALAAAGEHGRCAVLDPGDGRCCVSIVAAEDAEADGLPADERADLEERARLTVEEAYAGTDLPTAGLAVLARDLERRAADRYISARVDGVCREGALEIFADATRGLIAEAQESRQGYSA